MKQEKIYLDNASTTRLDERVFAAMKPCYFDNYAVATSEFGYSQGLEARETLSEARTSIAASLGAEPEEFIFTSGNTESSNLALKGVAKNLGVKKGKHIIVSKIEDFPVLQTAKELEKEGFEVDYLDVDEDGLIVMNPMKGLDMVATNLIKEIEVKDGIIRVVVDLPENHQFAANIKEEAKERLENLWDINKVIIEFEK